MEKLAQIRAAFSGFRKDDCGAVTVDYVVLNGALVGLGALVMGNLSVGVTELSVKVSTTVENALLPGPELPPPPPLG